MSLRRMTALIADDVLASRELLSHMLERLDIDVVVQVADGAKVLENLRQHRVDIAFLDIDMPGQTGLEVLESINSLVKAPWTIIVSAHSTTDNFQKAIDRGAKGFVVKPYSMAKIKQMIDNCAHVLRGVRPGPSR